MFIDNRTNIPIISQRAREALPDGRQLHFVVLMEPSIYECSSRGWLLNEDASVPEELELAMSCPIWDGTSITATGSVQPPLRGTLARRVTLGVDDYELRLVARGTRRWVRAGNAVVPGGVEAWTPLTMGWNEAFGGRHTIAAGRDPHSGLPHPEYVAGHPQNHCGKGFFPHADAAVGNELPRIELLEDQLTTFGQNVLPGCTAPAVELAAGMTAPLHPDHALFAKRYRSLFPLNHIAPAYLVMSSRPADTRVFSKGLEGDLELTIPSPRARPFQRRHRPGLKYGARLRAAHLDASRRRATVIWQHLVATFNTRIPDLEIREGAR